MDAPNLNLNSSLFQFGSATGKVASAKGGLLNGSDQSGTLVGKGGQDLIKGNNGDDILFGVGANDDLRGGNGDDLIFGGKGIDKLSGGRGVDTFVFGRNNGLDHIWISFRHLTLARLIWAV